MKKFFTLVLMLFASLQLFANAEIVIYNNSTGTTIGSDFTINSNNFKNIVEEGDNIVVTVKDYTRVDKNYPYFQIQWGDWEGWNNLGTELSNGDNVIPLTAADVTKINASTTYGINFRTNGTTSYTITKVVLRKNDSYATPVEITAENIYYTDGWNKAEYTSTECSNKSISNGDLLIVKTTTNGTSWRLQQKGGFDFSTVPSGDFTGPDFAYIVGSGIGAEMGSNGIKIGGNDAMRVSKLYLAKKNYYSLSEASDFDFSYVVTGSPVNVKLTRSITAEKWSTIVLPFDLTAAQVTSTFGTNVKVAELASGDKEKLTFNTVTTMNANKPYAILISSTDFPSDFSEATINGVTIVSGTPTQDITNWNFVGTYTSGNIPTGSYFFQNNQLFYAEGTGNHIKGFRAYFTPKGVGVRGFVGFSVDGQTTGIHSTLYDSTNKGDGKIYSLSGQIVTAPQKGVVYIVDGKKVIFNK